VREPVVGETPKRSGAAGRVGSPGSVTNRWPVVSIAGPNGVVSAVPEPTPLPEIGVRTPRADLHARLARAAPGHLRWVRALAGGQRVRGPHARVQPHDREGPQGLDEPTPPHAWNLPSTGRCRPVSPERDLPQGLLTIDRDLTTGRSPRHPAPSAGPNRGVSSAQSDGQGGTADRHPRCAAGVRDSGVPATSCAVTGRASRPAGWRVMKPLSGLAAVDPSGCTLEASQGLGPVPAADGQEAVHSGAGS
jgi:hypothetical protein